MKLIPIFLIALISCQVHARDEMFGWAYDGPLTLTEQETKEVTASSAAFTKRLGRVSFTRGNACINCGDFSDAMNIGRDHVVKRIDSDFLALMKKQLLQSGIFPENIKDRISLRATLTDLKQESSIGAEAEYQRPLTSGAILSTKVSVRYELIDQDQVVGTWDVTTKSSSNSLNPSTRLAESIDTALKRNLRIFLLKILTDYSESDSARAKLSLAALDGETDHTRTVFGYLVFGTTRTISATASATGSVLSAVAESCKSDPSCANQKSSTTESSQSSSLQVLQMGNDFQRRLEVDRTAKIEQQRREKEAENRHAVEEQQRITNERSRQREESQRIANERSRQREESQRIGQTENAAASKTDAGASSNSNSSSSSGDTSGIVLHSRDNERAEAAKEQARLAAEAERLQKIEDQKAAAAFEKEKRDKEQANKEREAKERAACVGHYMLCSCMKYDPNPIHGGACGK
jgi:hypothetical protein